MQKGKKLWVFSDGDLPPKGDSVPFGHEALMVLNMNEQDANLELVIYFEDKEPVKGINLKIPARRVKCFRMDLPLGSQNFKIPFGQYALAVNSDVPVVAVFGRLDRRKDMAYYSVQSFSS